MRTPIIVPPVETGDEPLRLCGWLVDEGDLVVAGDPVAEIVIPGLTYEILAESSGRLAELRVAIDSLVAAGEILGWLDDGNLEEEEI